MKSKLKNALASALAAATVVTSAGCNVVDNPDFSSDEYYQYDHSECDNYQIIYVEDKNGNIEPLLGKLYTTPISPVIHYKKVGTYEVIYDFEEDTNTIKTSYNIVDIISIDSVVPENYEIKKINTDEDALEVFNNFVFSENEKKLN